MLILRYANILSSPNNILGIEYLKALKKTKSHMIPMGVKRQKVLLKIIRRILV